MTQTITAMNWDVDDLGWIDGKHLKHEVTKCYRTTIDSDMSYKAKVLDTCSAEGYYLWLKLELTATYTAIGFDGNEIKQERTWTHPKPVCSVHMRKREPK